MQATEVERQLMEPEGGVGPSQRSAYGTEGIEIDLRVTEDQADERVPADACGVCIFDIVPSDGTDTERPVVDAGVVYRDPWLRPGELTSEHACAEPEEGEHEPADRSFALGHHPSAADRKRQRDEKQDAVLRGGRLE